MDLESLTQGWCAFVLHLFVLPVGVAPRGSSSTRSVLPIMPVLAQKSVAVAFQSWGLSGLMMRESPGLEKALPTNGEPHATLENRDFPDRKQADPSSVTDAPRISRGAFGEPIRIVQLRI